jgi:DNA-binding SARP family transcriptional activator
MLMNANELVSFDRLIDALWGDRPPSAARGSLHNLVAALRSLLGRERVRTEPLGYRLLVDAEQFDVTRFEHLRARARLASRSAAIEMLERALALWNGLPYADVFYEDFAQPEIRRLEELRLAALEDLYSARLTMGAAAEALPDLQALVALHPYRERLRADLMIALCRSGRAVEALVSYVQYQATLSRWQTNPGDALSRVAEAIKAADWSAVGADW